jgi:hypothetical protein
MAMSRLIVGLLAMLLAGCETIQTVVEDKPPTPIVCEDACKKPCDDAAAVAKWTCSNPDAGECWDQQQEQVTNPLIELAERCEVKRQACFACIERAETAGATCGTVMDCKAKE